MTLIVGKTEADKLSIGYKLPNGATVLEFNSAFVLAKTFNDEYVTWRWNGTDANSTWSGNYFGEDLAGAAANFVERSEKAGVEK